MITVTRLNGSPVVVNAGHLLLVERTPDTVLVLTTGHRIMVRETAEQVIDAVVAYRRRVGGGFPVPVPEGDPGEPAQPPIESES